MIRTPVGTCRPTEIKGFAALVSGSKIAVRLELLGIA